MRGVLIDAVYKGLEDGLQAAQMLPDLCIREGLAGCGPRVRWVDAFGIRLFAVLAWLLLVTADLAATTSSTYTARGRGILGCRCRGLSFLPGFWFWPCLCLRLFLWLRLRRLRLRLWLRLIRPLLALYLIVLGGKV